MKEKFKSWAFSKEHGKCDVITLIIYLFGVCTVSYFHEPWFDEAQSWAIARSGTIKEILFDIPHYEGHPPLWHLILVPFAKLGAPYELSLAAVNIFFMTLAVAVLLFKSPFPKLIRCLLPFNFFLFYQYGVVSRPYCILVLAIFLAAVCYKNRNEHPVKYLLCLALMCAVHLMGIIMAGSFCVIWLCEIFSDKYKAGKLYDVLKDKRCWLMLALLAFVVAILIEIYPNHDTYTFKSTNNDESFGVELSPKLIFGFFLVLAEATIGQKPDSFLYVYDYISAIPLFLLAVTLFVLCVMIFRANKKLSLFLLTYTFFAGFCILIYSSRYHVGLLTAFLIFMFWIILDEKGAINCPDALKKSANKINKSLLKAIKCASSLILIIPLLWSMVSSYNDICYPYWIRGAADFIKENNLEGYKILCQWKQQVDGDETEYSGLGYDDSNIPWVDYPNIQGVAAALDPYFDHNIFYNFNIDKPAQTYVTHRSTTENENKEIFAKWNNVGLPDVVIGRCGVTRAFPDINVDDYVAVAQVHEYMTFKFEKSENYITIYVTKDLFNKIGTLEELTAKKLY